MYALFFDSDGIVARVSVPENCSVTGIFYHDFVLSAFVNHYFFFFIYTIFKEDTQLASKASLPCGPL